MSRLSEFVTSIDTALNDATVTLEAGKLRLHEHGNTRRIIFVRAAGRIEALASPGRHRLGVAVSGVADYAQQVYSRKELIGIELRADEEDDLDELLDAFLSALNQVAGPNVLPSTYEWHNGDSSEGGAWTARQPAIRLTIELALRALPTPTGHSVTVAGATADLVLKGAAGGIAAGATVTIETD